MRLQDTHKLDLPWDWRIYETPDKKIASGRYDLDELNAIVTFNLDELRDGDPAFLIRSRPAGSPQ
jgi:hypothetical protein